MHVLFIGIILSLLVTETTGYSPGGIVVAGYLALFVFHPAWLFGTLGMAALTFGAVRLLESRVLLYGRRHFAVCLLAGMLLSQGAALATRGGGQWDMGILVIGYLVPGLIARDFFRQGPLPTLLALALTVTLTWLTAAAGEGWLW